jgi:predicted PurR-regulated permease PerM
MSHTLASARSTMIWIAVVAAVAIWVLRDLVLLVGYAVLLAYALLPAVKVIERVHGPGGRRLPRGVVAAGVVLTLVATVAWLLSLAVPRIAEEAARFATNAPDLVARNVAALRAYAAGHGLSVWLDPAVDSLRAETAGVVQNLAGTLAHGVARLFGGTGHLLGFTLLPLLAFYLLAESDAVRVSALRFVPREAHAGVARLGGAVDRALRSYVRGQAIVCIVTGALVAAALLLLHHPVALLLGFVAGMAELIPYLGFMAAALAIALAGSAVSPLQSLAGLAAYILLNWAVGTFVTPRVMGRYLRMHPFVVTVSVLAGAQLLGAGGALLALPAAAVLQAVIGELAPPPSPGAGGAPAAPRRTDV